jgi:hypothetical protein
MSAGAGKICTETQKMPVYNEAGRYLGEIEIPSSYDKPGRFHSRPHGAKKKDAIWYNINDRDGVLVAVVERDEELSETDLINSGVNLLRGWRT